MTKRSTIPGRRTARSLAWTRLALTCAGAMLWASVSAGQVRAEGPGSAEQSAMPCNATSQNPRIMVHVVGARSGKGEVAVTLYGSQPDRFLASGGSIARQRVPLNGATQLGACFAISGPGLYAVSIYHDENADHHFNRSLLGLPEEGYGFSNDAPTSVGLPSFDSVRFTVPPGESRMTIRLRY